MPSDTTKDIGIVEHDLATARQFARELGLPVLAAALLQQRNITTRAAAESFLQPRLAELPSPFLMKDMERAVELVMHALDEKWSICIHGDYDVDGITATALLSSFFAMIGVQTTCYQPNRLSEGYGLQPDFIRKYSPPSGEQRLLITVDCGISAHDEVQLAKEEGYTVIITDHHEPPQDLPMADAILNPKLETCRFPFPGLSGVGVAFYLAMAIRARMTEQGILTGPAVPNLKQLTDLVALGTVADVVPLTDVNRILVRAGLEVMNERPSHWVSALKFIANMGDSPVTAEDLSYRFAPRINAPGRLGRPDISFDLLTSSDQEGAIALASEIDAINTKRRELEQVNADLLFAECDEQEKDDPPGLVIAGNFHPGVIGILAARVVERYGKPALVLTDDQSDPSRLKGSGRSVHGINLYEVLKKCTNDMLQYGGHAGAAGLTIERQKVTDLKQSFVQALTELRTDARSQRSHVADYAVGTEELFDAAFVTFYHQLAPFGADNPEPVFLLKEVKVRDVVAFKNHIRFAILAQGSWVRGIGFGLAESEELLKRPGPTMLGRLRKNVFRGRERTELQALHIS